MSLHGWISLVIFVERVLVMFINPPASLVLCSKFNDDHSNKLGTGDPISIICTSQALGYEAIHDRL
jgi:hypothetical protein